VIGGLTSSLLLTLVLVPVVYLWIAPEPPAKKQPSAGAEHETLRALQPARDGR
jgi:hypothetical protein